VFPGGAKLLSTANGGMSGMSAGVTRNEVIAAIGVMLAACVATATAVHRLDQGEAEAEVKRIQGEAEARLMSAEARSYAEIKRIEGERALAESMWRNEIEHYKREVQLSYTHDYEPYKEAKEKNREKMKKKKREKDEKEEEEEESGVKTK
jgi:hypothetical protein